MVLRTLLYRWETILAESFEDLLSASLVELNSNVVSLPTFWGGSRHTQENIERTYLEAKTTHALNPSYGAVEPKCLQPLQASLHAQ